MEVCRRLGRGGEGRWLRSRGAWSGLGGMGCVQQRILSYHFVLFSSSEFCALRSPRVFFSSSVLFVRFVCPLCLSRVRKCRGKRGLRCLCAHGCWLTYVCTLGSRVGNGVVSARFPRSLVPRKDGGAAGSVGFVLSLLGERGGFFFPRCVGRWVFFCFLFLFLCFLEWSGMDWTGRALTNLK